MDDQRSAEQRLLQDTLDRCERLDERRLDALVADLKDVDFLRRLDGREALASGAFPHLEQVLVMLATRPGASGGDWVLELARTRAYSPEDEAGDLRRLLLVRASGHCVEPTPGLVPWLAACLTDADARYQAPAVHALARLGTPEAAELLWTKIFDPSTSVVPEGLRDSYEVSYTVRVGQHRDRPVNLALLLDRLYETSARRTVVRCLVEDVIQRGPHPKQQFPLAPLTAETPQAVALASQIAVWMQAHGGELEEEERAAIARRVADLLGQPSRIPASAEAADLASWARTLFERARDATTEADRRAAIESTLEILP